MSSDAIEKRQRIEQATELIFQQISCLLDSLDEGYRQWELKNGDEASEVHAAVAKRLKELLR